MRAVRLPWLAFVPSLTACLANSPGRRSLQRIMKSRTLSIEILVWGLHTDGLFACLASRGKSRHMRHPIDPDVRRTMTRTTKRHESQTDGKPLFPQTPTPGSIHPQSPLPHRGLDLSTRQRPPRHGSEEPGGLAQGGCTGLDPFCSSLKLGEP